MRSSYHVASRSSVRNTSPDLLVRRPCQAQVPLGRYSSTMAVIGQPPLLQPCRLSRACVELMWVKRCWSLLKEGSGGPEGEREVRETGKDCPGAPGTTVAPGDQGEVQMGVGMLQGTEGEEEEEGEKDEERRERRTRRGGREGRGEKGLAKEEDRGRKKEEVSHPSAIPPQGSGASFSSQMLQ